MKYKYNPKTHSVDELPEMKEPTYGGMPASKCPFIPLIDQDYYHKAITEYEKQKAVCKSYPLPVETPAPDNWPEVLEENVHFKIEVPYHNPITCGCENHADHCPFNPYALELDDGVKQVRPVAIPINNKIIMDNEGVEDNYKIVHDAFTQAKEWNIQQKRISIKETFQKLKELTGGYWDTVKCVCDALGRGKCDLNCPEHEENKSNHGREEKRTGNRRTGKN